jgi:putative transposase
MLDILTLLISLEPDVHKTSLRQMSRVAQAMLAMGGRVTMLGMSRWGCKGCSYRTIQRFFNTVLPWASMFWLFFLEHLYSEGDVYLLAGDEVVISKAGKQTYGVDRFFSSLSDKSIPGLAFFTLSLLSTKRRHSFPIRIEQVIKEKVEKEAITKLPVQEEPLQKTKKVTKKALSPALHIENKNKGGRPKGRKTKDKANVTLTPELLRIQSMVIALLKLIGLKIPLKYLILDGHFGNNNGLCMAQQTGLNIISKLRYDSALYFPYIGVQSSRGQRRKYGDRLDCRNIPIKYLQRTTIDKNIKTCTYNAQLLHEEFCQLLNVVVIVRTNLVTNESAHVLLFSSDLELSYDKLVDYYSLRFQIEFNFRDAKQFWGLEDFMNISQNAVTNAANLSFFMVNLSYRLLEDFHLHNKGAGIYDLKAYFRGTRYVQETIKMLPKKPHKVLLDQIFDRIASLGRIHAPRPSVTTS